MKQDLIKISISVQKVTSVLRDDLKELFRLLLEKIIKKKDLLQSLINEEKALQNKLKYSKENEDDIFKIIENQDSLIEMIDVIDYNSSVIKDEIKRKFSIDFDRILINNYSSQEKEIKDFRNIANNINILLKELYSLRNENNFIMNNMLEDIKIQADELARMRQLKIVLPKDPQSS